MFIVLSLNLEFFPEVSLDKTAHTMITVLSLFANSREIDYWTLFIILDILDLY